MRSWKTAKYIAMGLSLDREMGDDSVMECVKEGDEIKVYSSWTVVGASYAAEREGIVSNDQYVLDTSKKIWKNSNFTVYNLNLKYQRIQLSI